MGNEASRLPQEVANPPNEHEGYDAIFHIDSLQEMHTQGWRIEIAESKPNFSSSSSYGFVIATLGFYDRGKTHILNRLFGHYFTKRGNVPGGNVPEGNLPEGKRTHTEGLSWKALGQLNTPQEKNKTYVKYESNFKKGLLGKIIDDTDNACVLLDTVGLLSPVERSGLRAINKDPVKGEKKAENIKEGKEEEKADKEGKKENIEEGKAKMYNMEIEKEEGEEDGEEEGEEDGSYFEEKVNDDILREKKALEFFLVDMVFELADVLFLVFSDLTSYDQEIVHRLHRSVNRHPSKKQLVMIHNYKEVDDLNELKKLWEEQVLFAFSNNRPYQKKKNGIFYLRSKFGMHFVIGNDKAESTRDWNNNTFKVIRETLVVTLQPSKFNILKKTKECASKLIGSYVKNIKEVGEEKINGQLYLKGKIEDKNKPVHINPVAIDIGTGSLIAGEVPAYELVRLKNKEGKTTHQILIMELPAVHTISFAEDVTQNTLIIRATKLGLKDSLDIKKVLKDVDDEDCKVETEQHTKRLFTGTYELRLKLELPFSTTNFMKSKEILHSFSRGLLKVYIPKTDEITEQKFSY